MLMEYVKKKEKRKDAYPKKVCHMLAKACKKMLIARVGNNKRKRVMQKSSEIVQTLAHLDQTI